MRRLLSAMLAAAFVLIPAGAAVADNAGFYSAGSNDENRIHPAFDGDYCASQDLGVWLFYFAPTREHLLVFLGWPEPEDSVQFRLDGVLLENQAAPVTRYAVDNDDEILLWRTAIGVPSVGPLAVGTHTLETYHQEGVPAYSITFTISDC